MTRVLLPRPAVELVPAGLRRPPAPLLEEEGHAPGPAAVADFPQPLHIYRPGARAVLATGDRPVDPGKSDRSDGTEQWLEGHEPNCRIGPLEMPETARDGSVLDGDAEPDVGRWDLAGVAPVHEAPHQRAALGEHLVDVPVHLRLRRTPPSGGAGHRTPRPRPSRARPVVSGSRAGCRQPPQGPGRGRGHGGRPDPGIPASPVRAGFAEPASRAPQAPLRPAATAPVSGTAPSSSPRSPGPDVLRRPGAPVRRPPGPGARLGSGPHSGSRRPGVGAPNAPPPAISRNIPLCRSWRSLVTGFSVSAKRTALRQPLFRPCRAWPVAALVMVNSHHRSSGASPSRFFTAAGTNAGSASSTAQASRVTSLPSRRVTGVSPRFQRPGSRLLLPEPAVEFDAHLVGAGTARHRGIGAVGGVADGRGRRGTESAGRGAPESGSCARGGSRDSGQPSSANRGMVRRAGRGPGGPRSRSASGVTRPDPCT